MTGAFAPARAIDNEAAQAALDGCAHETGAKGCRQCFR